MRLKRPLTKELATCYEPDERSEFLCWHLYLTYAVKNLLILPSIKMSQSKLVNFPYVRKNQKLGGIGNR